MNLSDFQIKLLLGSSISRINKIHLCAEWNVQWRFQNNLWFDYDGLIPGRMEFLINNEWLVGKSWDEDEKVKLKDNK